MIKKELGFSRSEWDSLSWIDTKMYTEQFAEYLYERAMEDWRNTDPKKRGKPPEKPISLDDLEPTENNGVMPDIESIEGLDIEDN